MIFYYSYSVESVHEENDLRYVKPFLLSANGKRSHHTPCLRDEDPEGSSYPP